MRATESVQSADRYRFLADTKPQIVWTSKPDGNIDYYNKRWFDYTGMTIEQAKGWGWKHVIHPDDLQGCVERWTKAFTAAADYEVEYRFKRAIDGAYRWHLGRAFPLRSLDGEIIQWVALAPAASVSHCRISTRECEVSLRRIPRPLAVGVASITQETKLGKSRLLDKYLRPNLLIIDDMGLNVLPQKKH
jgi:PAS domain S-box-containing protein